MANRRIEDALTHLKSTFLEAPGLRLTADDVALPIGLDRPLCDALLSALESRRFLRRVDGERFELVAHGQRAIQVSDW